MNNLNAISKINALKQTDATEPADFQCLLNAATLIETSRAKVAIIGTKSKGKSLLINLLCKKNIADDTLDITIPTCIGAKCSLSAPSSTVFCNNNNVTPLRQEQTFCWGNICSCTIPKPLNLKAIYSHHYSTADGFFCLYDDARQVFSQYADILLPPDIPTKTLTNDVEKNIINMVDIADVVVLVGTPNEINSTIFDFILNNSVALNKEIIIFPIHQNISNYYHYALTPNNNAEKFEADSKTTAESLYKIIYAPETSPVMVEELKENLKKHTKSLVEKLEDITCKNYNKAKLAKVYYLPTSEQNTTSNIPEDQALIQKITNWQQERIVNELSQFMSKISGKTPFIAWTYFFRKFEDIYFDRIAPKWEEVYSQTLELHSRYLVIDSLLAKNKEELQILLRDYQTIAFDEEKLKDLFNQYCESKGFIKSLIHGKSTTDNLFQQMLVLLQQSAYAAIVARLKQQHNTLFPTCEQILTEALTASNSQSENYDQFIKIIQDVMLTDNLIKYWEQKNPLTQEKNDIINKKLPQINALKQELVQELAQNIAIATEVECDNEISFTISKHKEINSYSTATTLKSLC